MWYRVKIVKCLDLVVKAENFNELINEVKNMITACDENNKIYIHVLRKEDNRFIDEKTLYAGTVKGVLHHKTSRHDQP